ncbi:PI-PLC X-box domain-containing protein [Senna tora]|uniref:PI-PLC X-box domain-containing protein n=1 Tax=Senna tora TaxID=362788 RepID=A0A834XAM2_9FABA|nr:PI-PLC X-box domain-containing protein [Senna tora]
MGSVISTQIHRQNDLFFQNKTLSDLKTLGQDFPGSQYHPSDRKNWMSHLDPHALRINDIVWPGTHDSATDRIGIPFVSRPFAQCQTLSIYEQLVMGTRVLDIRVQEGSRVCHGILVTYGIGVVIEDVRRFLSETESEIVILEIRTEYGHQDPRGFEDFLVDRLGDLLIHQDESVFGKTIAEVLPRRIVCVWKPRKSGGISREGALWSGGYLRDNWINTDLPSTKFESNMKHLSEQPPATARKYFYRVENTVTPVPDNPVLHVRPVTGRIHGYARLFITQCFYRGIGDRLQIFSTDFIDEDFVDACVGLTFARTRGKA